MACYHPLKGFKIGVNEKSGKPNYKIVPYGTDHCELYPDGKWYAINDRFISDQAKTWTSNEFVQIPCGSCIGCRLDYSRQWAERCLLELEYHKESWFVTLTYDDDHVPWTECIMPDTGEVTEHMTLIKKEFSDFMKRLRSNYEYRFPDAEKLRFYACGEYGGNSYRPHYHAIIYGLHLDDLVFYKKNVNGDNLYNSEFLSKCWNNGFVVVGQVTWESCAYVARYIMKKQKGEEAAVYEILNIEPEFTLMSRRPGIAKQYYLDHQNMYEFDMLTIKTASGGKLMKHPRYFDKLYDVEDPDGMSVIKAKRKSFAEQQTLVKLKNTSYNYLEMLQVEEEQKKASIKALQRRLGDA